MEYLAFMSAIRHEHIEYVEETLKEYDIGAYLIAMETCDAHKETNGEHMHFLVQMTETDYHKYSKRVFKDKFKLRGKALKDKPRQYGKVNKINDLERMGAYSIKDDNIKTNMSAQQLQSYKDISFKATEVKDFRQKLMEHLEEYCHNNTTLNHYLQNSQPDFIEIGTEILKYYRKLETKIPLSKSQIESHIRYFQMYHQKDKDANQLIREMFPHN
jgi:hypothetical protein